MKTFAKTFILLFFISATFSSCEKIKSLVDVKFDSEFYTDVTVDILPGITNFNESATINPRDDSDYDKYYDKLKKFDIKEITGTIKSVNQEMGAEPVTIKTGKISFKSGTIEASWAISNFLVEVGNSVVLDNSGGQWDKINDILDAKKEFTARVEGNTDKGDVTFVVHLVIKAEVTANPL